jgi:hypothetical protein
VTTRRHERGRAAHAAKSAQIEAMLTARHVRFTFEPNLSIAKIREVEGNQVRFGEHRAPKDMVERYALQMKAGARFPAIVVNERHELIDGNTRLASARRNGATAIAAYVCSDLSALEARSLSVELNQSHGLAMTEEEVRAYVLRATDMGQSLDPRSCSRITGVKPRTLARWLAAHEFDRRARDTGFAAADVGPLSDATKASLNVARLRPVFAAATALAIEANISAAQLKPIITEANAAESESDALRVIATARELRGEDIRALAAGFKKTRRRSAGSAQHIGGLLRFEVEDLLDVAPEKQTETFERLERLRERVDSVLAQARHEWNVHPPQAEARPEPAGVLTEV